MIPREEDELEGRKQSLGMTAEGNSSDARKMRLSHPDTPAIHT